MGTVNRALVYITDDNPRYVKFTANAVKYAKRFVKDCDIVVLTTKKGLKIRGCTRCLWIGKYLQEYNMLLPNTRFPNIVFMKYLVPVIPEMKRYDKIVYYDPDTIIVSDRVNELFDFDTKDCYFGLVSDSPSDPKYALKRLHRYGIDSVANKKYYGVGLIVYNIEKIRSNENDYADTVAELLSWASMHRTEYPEQDPVNCCMKIADIAQEFDKYISLGSWADEWKKYVAVHFPGMRKKKILDKVCNVMDFVI